MGSTGGVANADLLAFAWPCLALFTACRGVGASRLLLSPAELALVDPVAAAAAAAAGGAGGAFGGGGAYGGRAPPPRSIEGRWHALRAKWGRESGAIEKMLKLEGLTKVRRPRAS